MKGMSMEERNRAIARAEGKKPIVEWKINDKRLKELRESTQVSLRETARILGMHYNMLSRLELGRVQCEAGYLMKLADYYEVSIEELLIKNKAEQAS